MKKQSSWTGVAVPVGLLLILLATLVPFFMGTVAWAVDSFRYVYTAGAALVLIARLFSPYKGTDMRLKRLHRLESWVGIIFGVAAFFAFYSPALRDWLAFTLAGAAVQAYTSIAIPLREEKTSHRG